MYQNFLLFVPSLLTRTSEIIYTVSNWDTEYHGVQTNEAVTKYLIDYLERNGQEISKIIMLCTDEVLNEQLDQINGKTTFEYYCEKINQYFTNKGKTINCDELIIPIEYHQKENESIDDVINPLKEIIQKTMGKNEEKRLYVDFTGGIRSAALTLVFACRILQSYGIKVEKILYSNIINKKIEECTRTYRLFDYFALQLEQKYGEDKHILEYIGYELETEDKERIEQLIENFKNLKKAKEQNQIERIIAEMQSLLNYDNLKISSFTIQEIIDTLLSESKIWKQHPKQVKLYLIKEALEKHKEDKAINLFRESFVDIMVDNHLIHLSDRFKDKEKGTIKTNFVVNELVGHYYYYDFHQKTTKESIENFKEKKYKQTFISVAKEYVQHLKEEPNASPASISKKYMGENFYCLTDYLNKEIPNKGILDTRFTERECDKVILPQMEKYCKGKRLNMKKYISIYQQMQKIYTGYGYPFACTYNNNLMLNYDKWYREIFESGVKSLNKYYHKQQADSKIKKILSFYPNENVDYQKMIQILNENDDMVRILFPFKLKEDDIVLGDFKGEDGNEILFHMIKSFCIIKDMRNKKAHFSAYEESEFEKAVCEMKSILEKIETYIKN